ncbi:MAG: glycerophosphoryl diester phosphodiesterase membrane domain-containing protein [Verrucomicrobia bacterium]|nr:glycerophosphoryl diester phosphodiesterase membrane domain-containing protein [Verrucomicrobiota bacterium]
MRSPAFLKDPTLITARGRVLRLWKPMAGWTICVWLAFLTVFSPLGSHILGMEIFRGGDPVVGNADLLEWIFSLRGVFHLILAASLGILAAVVRFTGIFLIVTWDLEGHRHSLLHIMRLVFRTLPRLFVLCVCAMVVVLAWMLPLAGGLALIYRVFLGDYDINYYLTVLPPEWLHARIFAGLWVLVWLMGALFLLGRLLLMLPAYLTCDYRLSEAIKRAWHLARSRWMRLLKLMAWVLAGGTLVHMALDVLLLFLARFTLIRFDQFFESVRPLVVASGGFVILSFLLSLVVGFLIFSMGATLLTGFYYEETSLHRESKPEASLHEIGVHLGRKLVPWLRLRRFVPLLLVWVALSVIASLHGLRQVPEVGEVVISAHRAGPPPAPENTLSALEAAIAAGADYTEIDVQLTRDGRVVVVHDEDMMRVAGSPLNVTRATFAELRELVQVPDDGSDPEMRRVATLEEFLERADGRIRLMVELKYYGFSPELGEAVVEIIRESGQADQVVLMSLDMPAIHQLRELAPDMELGFVSGISVGNLSRLPVDFLAVSRPAVNPRFLRAARRNEMKVHAWTINRKSRMVDLLLQGVDGLITDDPALAHRVREELQGMTPVERLLLRFVALVTEDAE